MEHCTENLLSPLLTMPRETDPTFLHQQSWHDTNFYLMMLLPNIKWGIICEVLRTMADIVPVFPMEGGKDRKGNMQYCSNHSLGLLLLLHTQMSGVRFIKREVSGQSSPGGLILCRAKPMHCDLLAATQWGILFLKGSVQRWLLQTEMLCNQIPSIPTTEQSSGHTFGNTKRCRLRDLKEGQETSGCTH